MDKELSLEEFMEPWTSAIVSFDKKLIDKWISTDFKVTITDKQMKEKEPILKVGDSLDFLHGIKIYYSTIPQICCASCNRWEDYKVIDVDKSYYKVANNFGFPFYLPIKETDEAILNMDLPKEWSVKITKENRSKIEDLKGKRLNVSGGGEVIGTYISNAPNSIGVNLYHETVPHGVEIPYELFLKHFDKPYNTVITYEGSNFIQTKGEEIAMKEEAVVHYKLKDEKYFKAAANLFGNKVASADGIWFDNKGDWKRIAEENDVLDLWFEKCKSPHKKEKVDMGGFELTIKDKKVFYGEEDITWYVREVYNWADNASRGFFRKGSLISRPFKVDLSSVILQKTGCVNKPSKLSDWLKVYDKIA